MGVGQFGLLSIALQGHISPGLASVVVQTAAFFNVALAALLLREQIKRVQVQGCVLAGFGLVIIALNGGTAATEFGILLVLLTALSFAICNVLLKHSGFSGDLVGFITWSSLFATIPLAGLSLLIEGAEALMLPVSQPSVVLWLLLGEELTEWKLVAAGFIISGLAAPYASGVGALRRRRPT
jgi:O-acetylserine/cysteine efflux transporter